MPAGQWLRGDHGSSVNANPSADSEHDTNKVYAANDTPIQVEGKLQLPFFLGELCIWTDALVSEDTEEVMLGIDWLTQNDCMGFQNRKTVHYGTADSCINSSWNFQMPTSDTWRYPHGRRRMS